eukprot:TRINITY_DN28459_c0_g1_i2.p1 TRINITY_DN28459_c0_g1~~TRINITY_DN28459_c0_g1_i2.p1  ORF type:complete len:463 (-),score=67.37 TRINITY_DN28459_c0_g1_i2:162-1550(-)
MCIRDSAIACDEGREQDTIDNHIRASYTTARTRMNYNRHGRRSGGPKSASSTMSSPASSRGTSPVLSTQQLVKKFNEAKSSLTTDEEMKRRDIASESNIVRKKLLAAEAQKRKEIDEKEATNNRARNLLAKLFHGVEQEEKNQRPQLVSEEIVYRMNIATLEQQTRAHLDQRYGALGRLGNQEAIARRAVVKDEAIARSRIIRRFLNMGEDESMITGMSDARTPKTRPSDSSMIGFELDYDDDEYSDDEGASQGRRSSSGRLSQPNTKETTRNAQRAINIIIRSEHARRIQILTEEMTYRSGINYLRQQGYQAALKQWRQEVTHTIASLQNVQEPEDRSVVVDDEHHTRALMLSTVGLFTQEALAREEIEQHRHKYASQLQAYITAANQSIHHLRDSYLQGCCDKKLLLLESREQVKRQGIVATEASNWFEFECIPLLTGMALFTRRDITCLLYTSPSPRDS